MYRIRRATAADAGVLARHRAEMFRDMGQLPDGLSDTLIDAARAYFTQAIADGRYVGWVAELDDRSGEIVAGAGLQLRELLRSCRGNGIESVVLHASGEGRPLYEKLGFTPTNEMRYDGGL